MAGLPCLRTHSSSPVSPVPVLTSRGCDASDGPQANELPARSCRMNAQRVSRIVGGVVLAAAVSVLMTIVWSRVNQSDSAPSVPTTEGRVMGDLTGFIGRVDQK